MLMLQALILSQRKRKLAEVLDNMIPFVSWIQTEEFVHMRGGCLKRVWKTHGVVCKRLWYGWGQVMVWDRIRSWYGVG